MTTTVLPASRRRCSTCSSSSMSWKCRPVVGSSSMYSVRPVSRLESSSDSLTRCASPPESVVARLAELDVAEADVGQRLELLADRRHRGEELDRLVHGHLQHFVDAASLVADLERLAVVALAVADVAGDVDVGQEVHLHLGHAVALAGFAAPALDVEREAPGVVAARARLGHAGEQLADRREQPRVGRRIGARRAADRALVDAHHLVEMLQARDRIVRRRLGRPSRRGGARPRRTSCR